MWRLTVTVTERKMIALGVLIAILVLVAFILLVMILALLYAIINGLESLPLIIDFSSASNLSGRDTLNGRDSYTIRDLNPDNDV